METGHFLMLFVTVLISSTVSSSEDHVFVQTGDSLKLDIKTKTLPEFTILTWTKNKSQNIVHFFKKTNHLDSYKDQIDFSNKTFSLTLRNMQKTDSGVYTAKAIGHQETNVATFHILVIDAVDSPVLYQNFTMISVNSCIVDVECSAHILTLSSRYHSNNCSQEEVKSSEIQTLTLYCLQNVVVCNFSNPVSWKNETIEMNQLCPPNKTVISEENQKEENISSFPLHWLLLIIASVTVLVFTTVSVICCFYKKRKKDDLQTEQTIYAQVQPENTAQRPLEMLEKSANLQTVYGFTGEHKQTDTNQTMPSPEIRAQERTENLPSTTYSTIGQHQTPMNPFPTKEEHTIYSTVCKSSRDRSPVYSY